MLNRKNLPEQLHLFVYPKWSFNLSNWAREFFFLLSTFADNSLEHSPKIKSFHIENLCCLRFRLTFAAWLFSLSWRDLAWRNKIWINFWLFLMFQWKFFFQTMSFWNSFEKFCCFHQLQAVFITFQCTKAAQRKEIFFPFSKQTKQKRLCARNVGSLMLFSVFLLASWSENEFCLLLCFVLKMKSFIGISHKRPFQVMGLRRCMEVNDCFPETCFESLWSKWLSAMFVTLALL